jgi:hypothetical protein
MAAQAEHQQELVLLAVQVVVPVITGLQQAVQQGHRDKVSLAATMLRRLHTHQAVEVVRLRLVQMALGLHLVRAVQGLHHQSPDHL